MPIRICPRCNQQIVYSKNSGPDIVHRCNSKSDGLDKDSILKVGDWTDADGTTGTVANANLQGAGTIAGGLCLNKNIDKLDVHSKRISTHRLVQHYEYIDLETTKDVCN